MLTYLIYTLFAELFRLIARPNLHNNNVNSCTKFQEKGYNNSET